MELQVAFKKCRNTMLKVQYISYMKYPREIEKRNVMYNSDFLHITVKEETLTLMGAHMSVSENHERS